MNCRYVDVILNLIRLAGDYVSEEVAQIPKSFPLDFKIAFLDFEPALLLILDILGLVQSHPDCDQQGRRAGEKVDGFECTMKRYFEKNVSTH